MNLLIFLLLLGTKVFFIDCESNCVKFRTCGECIGHAGETCIWCAADEYLGKRCQSESSIVSNVTWCEGELYNPKMTKEIIKDNDFNRGENKKEVVQFKPQILKLKARPGVPMKFNMSYKPAKDFPLDVYYLVDYSSTMKDQVQTLREQGKHIYEGLSNLTNNVRLGIGSFVEKPALPFADVIIHNSYSFKNHLSLTNDTMAFAEALNANVSGENYDVPEAGLDALMQVMTCKKEIGWRDMARRIIVLTTDSTYHSAGDGQFVGAIIPNDMACHLKDNMYAEALNFDYPSISQINKVVTENNFMVIFAVVPSEKSHYIALEKHIQGSKYAPLEKSPKLLEMIKFEYLALIRNLQLGYNVPDFVRFTSKPDCSKAGECILQHNQHIDIEGTLVIDSCPPNNVFNHIIEIGPRFLKEKLIITLEVDCQCDCEKPGRGELNSKRCSTSGTYQCGACKCNNNRHGDICQCEGNKVDMRDSDKCKANDDAVSLCSGRGTCNCGKCSCDKDFSGPYCEYDDKACLTADGKVCYGNGKCKFGKCKCNAQWLPEFCMCPVDDNRCIAPESQKVCSGIGKCVCGKCVCNAITSDHGKCSGTFCDNCEETAKRCKELEDYAYCNLLNIKSDCDAQYNITAAQVIIVNKTEINSDEYFEAKMWCNKIVEDDKIFMFKYYYPDLSTLRLIIQNELESPPIPNYLIAAASIVGAVLLIGIITVIVWKILVDLHDKREYIKFANESRRAGYDVTENPNYKPPTVNFQNPAYTN